MRLNSLKRDHPNRRGRIVGRGGKRGKTAGRGTKGQLARAGRKLRPEFRDIIKKIPKKRGSRFQGTAVKPAIVTLRSLNKHFAAGQEVNPQALLRLGLIARFKGRLPRVKILGPGPIGVPLKVVGLDASADARAAIMAAGGAIS